MRIYTGVIAVLLGASACGSGGGGDDGWNTVGECTPPADGTDLPSQVTELDPFGGCPVSTAQQLSVIGAQAEWDAMFDCPTPPPLPAGLDLATQRAAIVDLQCTPIDFTFAAERADEVVVGIHSRVSGACLGNVLVVPLPRSTKPVRLAQCSDQCGDECPPVAGPR